MEKTGTPRLLIVDDSLETVDGLHSFFSRRFDVLVAYDGYEGMRQLESARPPVDLVISDLLMSGVSGTGFISMIKTRFRDLPVIAITGWVENYERLVALTGADCILFKPFELEVLDEQVERLLPRR